MCLLVSSKGKTSSQYTLWVQSSTFQMPSLNRGSVHYTFKGEVVPPNLLDRNIQDLSGIFIYYPLNMWQMAHQCDSTNTHILSFAPVARYLFIQAGGKTVVEEEELTMRKESVQQRVHSITFQQYLKITAKSARGKMVVSNNQ